MQFANLLLIGSSFVVATLAQATPTQLAFTTLPPSVRAGEPATVGWAGGDDSPVTLTLKRGDEANLETVAIITGDATGNSFTWTPSKTLPNGDDYALEISQGVDETNYSGRFSLRGGSAAGSSATTSALSTSSSATITSAATLSSPIASLNNTVSSLVASVSNATNATAATTTTALVPLGTGAVGSGASGVATGTGLIRNTTLSSATLSSTRTSSSSASSTSGSESSAAGTSSAAGSEPTSDAIRMASPLALILGAFAAFVYLG